MSFRPSNQVLWFGVLGGPCAWFGQFIVNLMLTFAQCNQPVDRWNLPVHAIEIALSAAGIAIATAALGISLWMFRETAWQDHVSEHERRGDGSAPPLGRIQFLSMIGLTVDSLALIIMIMTGIGAPLLPACQQS